ncbi:galectin-4-like isoform X3 [Biomphalaria glabrata]|uniref:Galectin n=1 Tax=Biomphalaria glabrata TaxID=6526 RepID=A0A9U8E547_BIOGL|nr:galectin-4-like isoform X3 [Biomphalaria glabrata]
MAYLEQRGPGFYESSHVSVPYSVQLPGLQPGSEIVVEGKTNDHCKGFSVNFCAGPNMDSDVVFHYNPRLEQGRVVSNDKQRGNWGPEEIDAHVPFQRDQNFEIRFKISQHGYEVIVHNSPVHNFKHRLAIERVSHLFITGDISVKKVQLTTGQSFGYSQYNPYQPQPGVYGGQPQGAAYGSQPQPYGYSQPPQGGYGGQPQPQPYGYGAPPQSGGYGYNPAGQSGGPIVNPPVPFTGAIPGGMYPGKMIFVSGVVNPNAQRFSINLVTGNTENHDFGLHMDVRIAFGSERNVIVRTNKKGGAWGPEERQAPFFPFAPNGNFDVTILAEQNSIKVAANNQHLFEFHLRSPLQEINHVLVMGDVRLTQVRFQ